MQKIVLFTIFYNVDYSMIHQKSIKNSANMNKERLGQLKVSV